MRYSVSSTTSTSAQGNPHGKRVKDRRVFGRATFFGDTALHGEVLFRRHRTHHFAGPTRNDHSPRCGNSNRRPACGPTTTSDSLRRHGVFPGRRRSIAKLRQLKLDMAATRPLGKALDVPAAEVRCARRSIATSKPVCMRSSAKINNCTAKAVLGNALELVSKGWAVISYPFVLMLFSNNKGVTKRPASAGPFQLDGMVVTTEPSGTVSRMLQGEAGWRPPCPVGSTEGAT